MPHLLCATYICYVNLVQVLFCPSTKAHCSLFSKSYIWNEIDLNFIIAFESSYVNLSLIIKSYYFFVNIDVLDWFPSFFFILYRVKEKDIVINKVQNFFQLYMSVWILSDLKYSFFFCPKDYLLVFIDEISLYHFILW